MDDTIFKNKVYQHVKRMIGFVDSDPESITFGCSDRNYWHYKLHDYSNVRMQELCLTLAFCYKDENHEFYQNEKLLNLIKGIIGFWVKNRNKNGSANEIFPFEQSFCATSFSLYIILETIEILELEDIKEKYKKEFIKTGKWLSKNANWHITNQVTASILALTMLGDFYDNNEFSQEAKKRLKRVIHEYDKKGFFGEYGGFDLGYTTITLSLLSRFYQKNNDKSLGVIIEKEIKKLDFKLDKYGQYDNINMSRNTEFVYPFAFTVFKSSVLERLENGIKNGKILNPDWLDDRYLIGLSNDYLMTYFW